MSPVHQVWPKPSCKAPWKGVEDKANKGRGGKTTSGNGQAWSSASPRGQWRTGSNGENWLQNHLWCPNDPRVKGLMMLMMMMSSASFFLHSIHSDPALALYKWAQANKHRLSADRLYSDRVFSFLGLDFTFVRLCPVIVQAKTFVCKARRICHSFFSWYKYQACTELAKPDWLSVCLSACNSAQCFHSSLNAVVDAVVVNSSSVGISILYRQAGLSQQLINYSIFHTHSTVKVISGRNTSPKTTNESQSRGSRHTTV